MAWNPLATQFCLELAFGVLLALALVSRAPLGVLFFRLMGTSALLPSLLAVAMPLAADRSRWSEPAVFFAAGAVALYPVYSGPVRASRRRIVLWLALACAGAALVASVRSVPAAADPLPLLVASLSALATGSVAGSVGLAMVLGHWYLTIPDLEVSHLARLNRATVTCMLVSLAAIGTSCLVFEGSLASARTPLLGPWGLFHLGTRLAVGLLLPLLFAWMVADSLRCRNTRSATGILYASTVLVLIGTAVSISLQDSYGIPL